MTDDVPERHGVLRFLRRWRLPLVLIPLVAGLVVAGEIGAGMLWADVPDRETAPATVVCWDGVEQPRADCAQPTGAAGLRWVFPQFRPHSHRCHRLKRPSGPSKRPTQWNCSASFRGTRVMVVYSQSSTPQRGLKYFRTRYASVEERRSANRQRATWRVDAPNSRGRFQVSSSYLRFPYAVTVTAASVKLRESALDELVDFRPAGDILVRPAV